MSKTISKTAQIVQTLVYSDGPQLLLLKTNNLSYILAVAVTDNGLFDPFYGAEISETQLHEYLRERYDLRYLMSNPVFKNWYLFDLSDVKDSWVLLKRRQLTPELAKRFLPGRGIFAREHTEDYLDESENSYAEDCLSVDGSWELPEVSEMYSQYSDLYVIFNSVDIFSDAHTDRFARNNVVEAFNKPWEGGGSYGSFYNSMRAAQLPNERLRLGGMQYMSPGFVKIYGKQHPFHEVRRLVEHYRRNSETINKEYGELHRYLSHLELLTLPAVAFDHFGEVAENVATRAKKFAVTLDAIPYETLYEMSGKDQLTVAKVLLSIQRRLRHLYEFFDQGRVDFK